MASTGRDGPRALAAASSTPAPKQAEGPGEVVAGSYRHYSEDGAGPGRSLDGQVNRSVAPHGNEPLGAG